MAFYHLCLADPTISENARRAIQFAEFYLGEDEAAPNYDPRHKVLRSPFQTSQGPWLKATPEQAHAYLYGPAELGGKVNYYGTRATLYPVVRDLEEDWWKEPRRRREIVRLFDRIVLNADSPNNLGATGLITNAWLHTGDSRYRGLGDRLRRRLDGAHPRKRRRHPRQRGTHRPDRRAPRRLLVGAASTAGTATAASTSSSTP